MEKKSIIGIFLGGVRLFCGKVKDGNIEKKISKRIDNRSSEEKIIAELIEAIDKVFDDEVEGIGIGVPSSVDVEKGIVYKTRNIPSWREVHIKEILESRFKVKVYVNNDANCFAVGEKYFGNAREYENIVGLILSSGVGAGILFKGHLYSGTNCDAGEFGYLPYKEHDFEYYCAESYFDIKYGLSAETVYQRALQNDKIALAIYENYGQDVGHLIKAIMYSVDPEVIIIGGSLSKAFPFFQKEMHKVLKTFTYPHALKSLKVTYSDNENIFVLGAAALFYDAENLVLTKY